VPDSLVERRALPEGELRKFAASGYLYAVLDATDAPAVLAKVAELGETRAACLFKGEAEEFHSDSAPYLMQVSEPVLAWLKETLWDDPWGVLVAAAADLETVRKHLRRFLWVQAPAGEQWYFRFYDPRVLEMYLPTCLPQELQWFYGPVRAFGVTNDERAVELVVPRAGLPPAGPPPSGLWPIRQPQVDMLGLAMVHNFVRKVAGMLRQEFPAFVEKLGDDELRDRVWMGLARARSHGIRRETTLAGFITMMFVVGPDFDRTPRMAGILADEAVDPDRRMERVLELPQQAWSDAVEAARAGGWNPPPGEERP
jgi:hypothetical protein